MHFDFTNILHICLHTLFPYQSRYENTRNQSSIIHHEILFSVGISCISGQVGDSKSQRDRMGKYARSLVSLIILFTHIIDTNV